MPYFEPGDPYPRKTPAELKAEEDARPLGKKVSEEIEQVSDNKTVFGGAVLTLIALVVIVIAWIVSAITH